MQFSLKKITKEQGKDTGMAMVLILLIFALMLKRQGLVLAATIVLVVDMTAPSVFRPIAVVWFGLSHVLGLVVSRILLAIVFFAVVTPVGLLRRLMGKDSLKLKHFKASRNSVMSERNYTFSGADLEKPY